MTTYLSKLGSSISGVFFGVVVIFLAIWLLSWNEGKAVRIEQGLNEVSKVVQEIALNNIDPSFDGKAVYLSGDLVATKPITDTKFGIQTNDLKLKRHVEMYQWKENVEKKEKELSDGTTKDIDVITYEKVWSDKLIDSSSFEQQNVHTNPSAMPLESEEIIANEILIGKRILSPGLVKQLSSYKPHNIDIDNPMIATVATQLNKRSFVTNNVITFNTQDVETPTIGALRVTFTKVSPQKASIIAQQIANTFEPYKTKSGESVEILKNGVNSDKNIISDEQDSNNTRTWMFRVMGTFALFVGFSMMFKPLAVLADVVPILNSLVSTGIFLVSSIFAITVATITIAISWFAFRPLLSGAIILIAIGGIIMFLRMKNTRVSV